MNNVPTSIVPAARENFKPRSCYIDLALTRFSLITLTLIQYVTYIHVLVVFIVEPRVKHQYA